LLVNLTQSSIADGQRIRGVLTPQSLRLSPGGNRGFRPALANGFIAGLGVLAPIAGNLTDVSGNLRQQPRKDLAIVNLARSKLNRHNLFRLLIDSQMEFAPDSPPASSMLLAVPLTCSINPKTGGINHDVTRPAYWG
jgi:hypothetical protein